MWQVFRTFSFSLPVWDMLVRKALRVQYMWACLTVWFLWGSIQISLCKLVILNWVDGDVLLVWVVPCMTLHQS